MEYVSLHITVNKKPGVLSSICAIYAQRGYNLEGVVANRNNDGVTACVWMMIKENSAIGQVVEQISALPDILSVSVEKGDESAFDKCAACMSNRDLATT